MTAMDHDCFFADRHAPFSKLIALPLLTHECFPLLHGPKNCSCDTCEGDMARLHVAPWMLIDV